MALWGIGGQSGQKQPTWQKNKNIGRKDRPAINDRNETYIAKSGWTQQVTKAGRILRETLVATAKNYTETAADQPAGGAGVGPIRSANIVSMTWQDRDLTFGSNLYIDVAFDQRVIVQPQSDESGDIGRQTILVTNALGTGASGGKGIIKAYYYGTGNDTNILTFTARTWVGGAGAVTGSGNGQFKIVQTGNIGSSSAGTQGVSVIKIAEQPTVTANIHFSTFDTNDGTAGTTAGEPGYRIITAANAHVQGAID